MSKKQTEQIDIKNRWTGEVIHCGEHEDIRACLLGALKAGANLSEANLYGADLGGANLYRANLSEANLYRANLSEANLYGANLTKADLGGANLDGADLSRANLSEANLSRADLYGANLYGADLTGADLSRANLSAANLDGADLSRANLDSAVTDATTIVSSPLQVKSDRPSIESLVGSVPDATNDARETNEDGGQAAVGDNPTPTATAEHNPSNRARVASEARAAAEDMFSSACDCTSCLGRNDANMKKLNAALDLLAEEGKSTPVDEPAAKQGFDLHVCECCGIGIHSDEAAFCLRCHAPIYQDESLNRERDWLLSNINEPQHLKRAAEFIDGLARMSESTPIDDLLAEDGGAK